MNYNKKTIDKLVRNISNIINESLSDRIVSKEFPRGNFDMLELNEEEKEFLTSYYPLNKYTTSKEELHRISEFFNLEELDSTELHALRNSVVEFYSDLFEDTFDADYTLARRYNLAMQSVTAVIDIYIYH